MGGQEHVLRRPRRSTIDSAKLVSSVQQDLVSLQIRSTVRSTTDLDHTSVGFRRRPSVSRGIVETVILFILFRNVATAIVGGGAGSIAALANTMSGCARR